METGKRNYYLEIADNAHILSHRLAENCSRGPFLEEDLACTNVALDLIGLAESVYNEIAKQLEGNISGDDVAYRRDEIDYRNCLLTEQPNDDFAHLMTRQFFMDTYHYYIFTELSVSSDTFLSALANKSLKEVTYHLKRSSEWMIRFGNGTKESSERAQAAINRLWRYTDELFTSDESYSDLIGTGVYPDQDKLKKSWMQKVDEVFFLAQLRKPENKGFQLHGGKSGRHSEHMGYILSEMQFLPNKYPDATW
ncbi:MAG: phenylacetate-CoA oxygenase subunit PaaC [bacterium]|nr:phenylacetate-CoA oxygenase subunit PaaC [bacterium]